MPRLRACQNHLISSGHEYLEVIFAIETTGESATKATGLAAKPY